MQTLYFTNKNNLPLLAKTVTRSLSRVDHVQDSGPISFTGIQFHYY